MPCPYEITFVFSFENWVWAALLPTYEECPNSFPLRDCVAMHKWPILVISSRARDLAFSATCEEKISRLWLEMTIATQSLTGKDKGRGDGFDCFPSTPIPAFPHQGERRSSNMQRYASTLILYRRA
jgi:hypothetical protein